MGIIAIGYALLWIAAIIAAAGLLIFYIVQRSKEKKEEAKKDYKEKTGTTEGHCYKVSKI